MNLNCARQVELIRSAGLKLGIERDELSPGLRQWSRIGRITTKLMQPFRKRDTASTARWASSGSTSASALAMDAVLATKSLRM